MGTMLEAMQMQQNPKQSSLSLTKDGVQMDRPNFKWEEANRNLKTFRYGDYRPAHKHHEIGPQIKQLLSYLSHYRHSDSGENNPTLLPRNNIWSFIICSLFNEAFSAIKTT
jgi:hypothetical protein